ncbi:hypothetical protein [Xanthobacter oligotrophicus]|uniref:hypothetical protein n=1 Tax=Xanthobacter oligotrophicus TaxID=2607286 RepID=UPI0011F39F13|nr:hypothetical protein [Xanthobacter oligotrophicus]MCG5237119.1 hypothetical protein [Xanthobacter oligotrophicus]
MKPVTSSELIDKIASLDAAVLQHEQRVSELSLQAVEGDEEARRSLVDILVTIDRAKVDRLVLQAATDAARQMEHDAAEAALAKERERHLSEARVHARELLLGADRFESLASDLLHEMVAMSAAEDRVWLALRAGGQAPNAAVVGRRNIADFCLERLQAAATGRLPFRHDKRSGPELARNAWQFLIEEPSKVSQHG